MFYGFHLDFSTVAGEFSIELEEGATTFWDVTVSDSTFTGGVFGFYNYSQQTVKSAGFKQTGGIPVPEPSVLVLIGLEVSGLVYARRKVTKPESIIFQK